MKPAQVVIDAPASLASEFAPMGYAVHLVLTRTGKLDIDDTGATPAALDKPFERDETKILDAAVALYERIGRKK